MTFGRYQRLMGVQLLLSGLLVASAWGAGSTHPLQFNRDIRPILSENCFVCHGPDKNNRKAKIRLDVREVALEKGAVVPGNPQQRELVNRIYNTNEDDVMPPLKSNKKLTAAQKKLLRQWIAEGAEYQPHWAYIKPVRSELPRVRNEKWVRNPIDAFVLSALEQQKIKPSPVGLGRGFDFLLFQRAQDKRVNRIPHPFFVPDSWQFGPHGFDVGPVRVIFRAFGNPLPQQFLLRRCEFLVGFQRWHHIVLVRVVDAVDQFPLLGVAGNDGALLQRDLADVEPNLGLAIVFVRAVTDEAVLGENRPDVAVELQRMGRTGAPGGSN